MIALRNARVIDGISRTPVERATILVEGPAISAFAPEADVEIPMGTEVYDLDGMTVLPGLIDMHVHLCASPSAGSGSGAPHGLVPETDLTMWGAFHARADLAAGFTTVRDAFSFLPATGCLSLRRAVQDGILDGPRIYAAGYAGMTGSIVDMRFPSMMERPYGFTADGPWELRKRTREVLRAGFDWIKTFTSGGRNPGQQEDDTWYTNHTREELAAIIDEAHNFGAKVMIHATTYESIKLAVECNVDTIEHGWPLDDALIELMLDRKTVLVPTISVYSKRAFLADGVQDALKRRAERQVEIRLESFLRAYKAGVPIANGSDIAPALPTIRHGENAYELAHMVEAGMAPIDAIISATSTAAHTLGADDIGTVAPGRCADLVVVDGDPIHDISVLETRMVRVFKDGRSSPGHSAASEWPTPTIADHAITTSPGGGS